LLRNAHGGFAANGIISGVSSPDLMFVVNPVLRCHNGLPAVGSKRVVE
jgi:hypothetical protein